MNCANHPDIATVAYCRTCGKPMCANCTRDVKGVIYCENCLADRLQGVQPAALPPAAGFVSSSSAPVASGSGPNPALAGILSGFFPFGVGAVYCGQYAKGLAHLVTFTLLVWGETVVDNAGLNTILAFGIAFFYVWQIIDSVRTAHAIQAGQPVPDPFGSGSGFWGWRSKTITAGTTPAAPGKNRGVASSDRGFRPDRPGCPVSAAHRRNLRIQRRIDSAPYPDRSGLLALRETLGLDWIELPQPRSCLPHARDGWTSRSGYGWRSFANRGLKWSGLAPYLASVASGNRNNQADGKASASADITTHGWWTGARRIQRYPDSHE